MSDNDQIEPAPVYYRSEAEASALRPVAVTWIAELERQLPASSFEFHLDTLFVGRTVPEEVGCIALTVPGVRFAVLPLEFALNDSHEPYVDGLIRYYERVMSERDDQIDH